MKRLLLSLLLLATPAAAQDEVYEPDDLLERPVRAEPRQQVKIGALLAAADRIDDPARRLGVRASILHQTQKIIPAVVIVDNAASYVEAIAGWHGFLRYPVLWDDGSPVAREHIARFVRAFKPDRVVRFTASDDAEPWPKNNTERIRRIRRAQADALGFHLDQPGYHDIVRAMVGSGIKPCGLIIADAADPAWPAALALGAGRIEPIHFVKSPGRVNATLTTEQAESFAREIHKPLTGMKLAWDELGDDIDAVTLALAAPARVHVADVDPQKPNQKDIRALTDLIGRHGSVGAATRWAWCGQIVGHEAQSTYQASCALFLETDSAWVFDGYAPGQPWDRYDGSATRDLFDQAGWSSTIYDHPRAGIDQWRLAAAGTVDAGLILINTHGQNYELNFTPGRGACGDMPVLQRPAMMHIVHSFSAQLITKKETVGGRALLNGVYAMVGSVHEPFLDAFVPTPAVAGRLLSGYPLGAAGRTDHRGWWRIGIFGDPLTTVGPAGTRIENAHLPLSSVHDLDDDRVESLKDRDYARAIETLELLGRDTDAARLAAALLEREPESFTPAVASVSIMPLLRTRKHAAVIDAFARLNAGDQQQTLYLDALWHASRIVLLSRGSIDAIAILRGNLRPRQQADDAIELARHIAKHLSRDSAVAFLRHTRDTTKLGTGSIRRLNKAIEGYISNRP